MSERMERASIMDYRPVSEPVCGTGEAVPVEPAVEEPAGKEWPGQEPRVERPAVEQKTVGFSARGLYHSAKPPEDF